jgi:ABC-type Fe3+-hydroxamate transport system substrate-binding protein
MRSIASATLGTAAGLALVTSACAANAQTVITSQPAQAVTTETTTRTVRTLPPHAARGQVVTTQTVTQRIVPAPTTVIDRRVAARTYPRPIYDEVVPAPAVTAPQPVYSDVPPAPLPPAPAVVAAPTYSPPLYDEVIETRPTTVIDNGSIIGAQPYMYRYVYQPNGILVVDPATGDVVQTIPR